MMPFRNFWIAGALLALVGAVHAEVTGPMPLAWRWVQPTNIAPTGKPLVVGDAVYVCVGPRVYKIDLATGNMIWRFPPIESIPGRFRSTPIVEGDTMVVAGDNKVLYAANAVTGQPKWEHRELVSIIGQPALVGKTVVFALSDNSLNAVNLETGEPVWEQPVKVYDGVLPNLAGMNSDVLFFTNTFELRSLNVSTGKLSWTARFGFVLPETEPVVYGNDIYVGSGNYLAVVNGATGRARWQTSIGSDIAFNPSVSASGVAVTSREGKAYLFDLNGRAKFKDGLDLGSLPASSPIASDNYTIVPTTNGAVNLIDNATGKITWSYVVQPLAQTTSTGGGKVIAIPASAQPQIAGNTLLMLAKDGSLLAFDKNLGIDLTSPKVSMLWPNPGDQIPGQPPLDFVFQIADEASGINPDSLTVTVDGLPYEYKYTRDGIVVVSISNFNKNKPLRDGRRVIQVTVSDWMGNISKETFTLSIDNSLPPLAPPSAQPNPQQPGGRPPVPGGTRPPGSRVPVR